MRSGKISRRNCFQFLFILSVLVSLNRTCLSWAANTQFLPSIKVVFANKNILYFFFSSILTYKSLPKGYPKGA